MGENEASVGFETFSKRLAVQVIPEQKKVIEGLSVGTLAEKVGPSMAATIESSFADDSLSDESPDSRRCKSLLDGSPKHFSTPACFQAARRLFGRPQRPQGLRVAELNVGDEESAETFVARQTPLSGGVKRIEVFAVASDLHKDENHDVELPISHLLVVNPQNGLVADLVDLLPPGTTACLEMNIIDRGGLSSRVEQIGKGASGEKVNPGQRIVLHNKEMIGGRDVGDVKGPVLLHESAHLLQFFHLASHANFKEKIGDFVLSAQRRAYQYFFKKEFARTGLPRLPKAQQRRIALMEKNAWQFTLATIWRYRELGVDPVPELSDADLLAFSNLCLRIYQDGYKITIPKILRLSPHESGLGRPKSS
ncbi:MAG: hypothetical protein JW991_00280 [Candidatus Pacebacteria bacterium]|nr:hypothetical protein [Candidatus Paceibacterota bacterium]